MNSSYETSRSLYERAARVLAGGVSSEFRKVGSPHPLIYTHGKGSRIWDADGNEYLDFTLSQGPLILGHGHPHVLDRVDRASREGQLFAGQHLPEIELAEKLQALIPSAERVRFSLSGSEAVQAALRVARAATGRPKFVRFEGHYHGWLDNVAFNVSAPTLDSVGPREAPNAIAWTEGLPIGTEDQFIVLPWNDLDFVESTLARRSGEIAAIITEPVMCNNGCIPPQPGFLQNLRDLCDRSGALLIFDEVITGFRIDMGGAQAHFAVTPDLAIFAKAMASGYPISALVGLERWMRLIAESRVIHAGTMNSGNPCVAAALATIEVLERDKVHERLYRLGLKLMDGLRHEAAKVGMPVLIQGSGPMFHMGFTTRAQVVDF